MFCTKCGNPISDTAKFCTRCGARVEDNNPLPLEEQVTAQPEAPVEQEQAPAVPEAPAEQEQAPTVPEAPVEQEQAPAVPEASAEQEQAPAVPEAPVEQEQASAVPEASAEQEQAPAVPEAPVEQEQASAVPEASAEQEQPPVIPAQGYGVQDVTITANRWIPGDEQQFPASQEPAPKKKSKKGLIIALCSVAVVLAAAVGLAFFFSGRFSGKVEELGTYSGSALVSDRQTEFDDLLSRAQESTGVIHVFETFSLGSEIDSFLEKVDERKKALPEEALAAYKELNELSNRFFIETWGAEIVSYGKDINTAIGNEDYETLAAKAKACKELEEEIISANYRFATELASVRDTLIDMRSSMPSYALFKDDADDLIEDINNALSSDKKAQFPYYVDRGNEMIERIEEANGSFTVVNDRKEYYDELFEQLEITDRDRYNELQLEYSSALSGGSDAERLSDIVDELADFYEETYSDNYEEFERLLSKIDNFDPSRLTADEYEVFSAAYEEMHEAANSDDVARMLQKARLCEEYVNIYIQKITECDRFMTLAERLASDFFFEYGYDDQLDEEEICFICENVLTPELKDELKNTLGWGEESESEESGLWTCGFSRSECEDLAYFITGQKHYFYQDISDYSEKMFVPENTGTVRKGDVRVTENDDGSLDLDYDIQAFYDGFVYSIHVTINAVYNEDSFFDHYSVASIEMNDYVYLDYYSVYRKAIEELVSYEPDHYTEDQFGRHLSFAYIDDDYIPELYITSVYGYACAYLVTFVDNDNYRITQLASGDGFNEYIPGEGVIRVCDGRQGYYVDEVVRIRDDGYTEVVFSGENSYVDFDSEEKRYDVTIPENLEDTDATTYYGLLDEIYTSKGESYYLTGDYTLSMMLDMLDEIINYVATY